VLVIGNKYETVRKKPTEVDDEMGLEEINISAHDPGTFAAGSHPAKVVGEFLDKVICTQFYQSSSQYTTARSTTTTNAYSQNLSIKPPRNPRIQDDVIRSQQTSNPSNTVESLKII